MASERRRGKFIWCIDLYRDQCKRELTLKSSKHPKAIAFQNIIHDLGLNGEVVEFEKSTRSAQEAADAIGCELGQIVKSLIFKGISSGKGILVLTSGKNRVSEKGIRALIGEKLGKADADFVREKSGYSIGGVPPFGHLTDFVVYIDEDFKEYEVIWAAAGLPNAVFPLSVDELIFASGGILTKVKEE